MVDPTVPMRLRRAILVNDVLLVKRIIKNNPSYLENPDFRDRGNTSLHLAAIKGHLDTVKLLICFGHDSCTPTAGRSEHDLPPGISLNNDSSTPLHLAAANSNAACVDYLCTTFPHTIDWRDGNGMTALMLAAQSSNPTHTPLSTSLLPPGGRPRSSSTGAAPTASEDTATVTTLLSYNASVTSVDSAGNTALHHATAWGNLKAVRVLLSAGAPSLARNAANYTPLDYSITQQAAQYFQGLIAEFERSKVGDDQPSVRLKLNTMKASLPLEESRSLISLATSPVSPVQLRMREVFSQMTTAFTGKSGQGSVRMVLDTDNLGHAADMESPDEG